MSYTFDPAADDRRVAERRQIILPETWYARRTSDRRISPAIGEHAVLEAHRLREELADIHSSLKLAAANAKSDARTIAQLRESNTELVEATEYAIDCLERYTTMVDPECECEPCPQCEKMPIDCTGTECAQTCQCNECNHCHGVAAITIMRAAIAKTKL